ncbi:MAG: hypothetical protein GXP22_10495 [Gammaproteobacteria bacterium]|nr:hypothetical protein [Gammaproteobacteria bacterium]
MSELTINPSVLPTGGVTSVDTAIGVSEANVETDTGFSDLLKSNIETLTALEDAPQDNNAGGDILPVVIEDGDELPLSESMSLVDASLEVDADGMLRPEVVKAINPEVSGFDETKPEVTTTLPSPGQETTVLSAMKQNDVKQARTSPVNSLISPELTTQPQVNGRVAVDDLSLSMQKLMSPGLKAALVGDNARDALPALSLSSTDLAEMNRRLISSTTTRYDLLAGTMAVAEDAPLDLAETVSSILSRESAALDARLSVAKEAAMTIKDTIIPLENRPVTVVAGVTSSVDPALSTLISNAQSPIVTDSSAAGRMTALSINVPLQQMTNWGNALAERMLWMSGQDVSKAEIRLNPAQLGPMEVRIQIQNDQAQISFTAQHASVRESLEMALPRLREMFDNNGINLVSTDISEHSFAQQREAANRSSEGFDDSDQGYSAGAEDVALSEGVISVNSGGSNNMLDLFV